MSNYVNGNHADNNWRNDNLDEKKKNVYVPPALRNRLSNAPENAIVTDYNSQQNQGTRRGSSYNNQQTMKKSPPKNGLRGGYVSGGRGRGKRDDYNSGGSNRNNGTRQSYGGRFSYDQRNVQDENQWVVGNKNSRWAALDEPDDYQVQHHSDRFKKGPVYGSNQSWQKQDPPDPSFEAELFCGMNSGINFDKYEEIPVEATGENCPEPIKSFADLELHEWIQENIKKSGYDRPTPVQKYSIPTLNSRRDLMSCAQTGSGKTAAFLIPVINQILKGGPGAVRKSEIQKNGRMCQFPLALIISPTRELSLQIYNESRKFAYRTPVISALLYGGRENYRDQINKLRLGVHVLIATPGRLIDVIQHGYIGLDECRFLVLDEADRMLDMGFEPQIRQIVELNGMPHKGDRVTAMFSATFPNEIQMLAQDFLMPNYVFLAVGRVGSTSENITQEILWVEEADKRHVLRDLLDAIDSSALTLIFVETKRGASTLAEILCHDGYNVVAIHGDLKQVERETHLESFRSGNAPILVATAVAARGLDIPNVKYVINYDLPNDIDEYVHRIGRTGRVGNTGYAKSFLNDKNRNIARDLAELLVEANQVLPNWFDNFVKDTQKYGVRGNRNRGNNSNRFGGRDHRFQNTTPISGSLRNNPTPTYSAPTYSNGNANRSNTSIPITQPVGNSSQKCWWE